MNDSKIIKRSKRWLISNFWVIVLLFALLAVFISLYIGLRQSVWFDEAYSITLAKKSFSEIIRLTSVDVHPPFYYLILHVWGGVFGWSELALRSLSAIALGGSIVVAGFLTKKLFGLRSAYFVLPLITFSPILLRYGFEIRMYALASLIGIGATYVLLGAVNSTIRRQKAIYFAIYSILVALGMFLLYYMALLWLGHFVWLVWLSIKNKKSIKSWDWFLSYLASVVLFLPWMPFFIKQLGNGALAPISQSMTVENLVGIVSFNFLYRPVWQLGASYSLVTVLLVVVIIYFAVMSFQKINQIQKKRLIFMAMYILVPIIILTIVGLFAPMYTERYLSHIAIGGLIFIGVSFASASRNNFKLTAIASLTILCLVVGVIRLGHVGNYNFQRLQKPDVKTASKMLSDCGEGKSILASDPYVATELGYYISGCDINFYSQHKKLGGGYAPLSESRSQIIDPSRQLKNNEVIYYVYYGEPELTMPENFISTERQQFGGMTVQKYVAKSI